MVSPLRVIMSVQSTSMSPAAPAASFSFHDKRLCFVSVSMRSDVSPRGLGLGQIKSLCSQLGTSPEHTSTLLLAECLGRATDATCNGASWTGTSSYFWSGR